MGEFWARFKVALDVLHSKEGSIPILWKAEERAHCNAHRAARDEGCRRNLMDKGAAPHCEL